MADHSHIEWTDATWNPVTGCSVVSPGCTNCYAMKLAGTRLKHHPYFSLTVEGHQLASAILAARDERRSKSVAARVQSQPPSALAA